MPAAPGLDVGFDFFLRRAPGARKAPAHALQQRPAHQRQHGRAQPGQRRAGVQRQAQEVRHRPSAGVELRW
jgi:hypothetical protein